MNWRAAKIPNTVRKRSITGKNACRIKLKQIVLFHLTDCSAVPPDGRTQARKWKRASVTLLKYNALIVAPASIASQINRCPSRRMIPFCCLSFRDFAFKTYLERKTRMLFHGDVLEHTSSQKGRQKAECLVALCALLNPDRRRAERRRVTACKTEKPDETKNIVTSQPTSPSPPDMKQLNQFLPPPPPPIDLAFLNYFLGS